ncbi:MAG: ice-binding family protein [Anaerolineaceae bacterium]
MMRKLLFISTVLILIFALSVAGPSSSVFASRLNAISPDLGAAASYSVLAGTTVTNTGPTTMSGNLGVNPGSAVTGFPPGEVILPGVIHAADADSLLAQTANTATFGFLDQDCDTTYTGVQDLGGLSLVAGTYCADAFTLTGNLTLEGTGVWIFKSASTLITSPESSIIGGDPCNVWWRLVSSATIGTYSNFIGNILASTSIALQTGASLNGRALAQTGAVTLDSNIISAPPCYQQPVPTSTATATVTSTATATATATTTPTGTFVPPTETSTPEVPTATSTIAAPTATDLPVVTALPPTGGAPLRSDSSPWVMLSIGGFSALAILFSVRAYRKSSRSR